MHNGGPTSFFRRPKELTSVKDSDFSAIVEFPSNGLKNFLSYQHLVVLSWLRT